MIFAGVHSDTLGIQALAKAGVYLSDTEDDVFTLPGVDGQRWLRSTQTPRELPVRLRARAASVEAMRTKLDAVAAWLASGPAQLVFDELPDRAWTARRRGALAWELDGGTLRVAADAVFVTDDPHPYAIVDDITVLSAPGDVPRTHGNATSWPTIEIRGDLTAAQAATLDLWGQAVTISGPLAAGETACLDYREYLFTVLDAAGAVARSLAPQLSSVRRITCPVGGGPVSWSTTGSVTRVRVEAHSRWL